MRREYPVKILVNRIFVVRVVIDPHYEIKHAESISDELILELVQLLNGEDIEEIDYKAPYRYFVSRHLMLLGKRYKIIWLLEDNEVYLGIVNAYRSK